MPPITMTPELQALDNDLKKTETIIGLKDGQGRIITMIEEEKAANQDQFEKGARRFQHLEEEVQHMRAEISKGFKKQEDNFNNYISETKNTEISKLNKKLDTRDYVKNGVIITLVGGFVLWLSIGLAEKYLIPEPKIVYIEKKVK